MENNKISVIIPVYNLEAYVERAVRSVLQQTYTNIEVLVVDDGSTDESWNVIQRISNSDNRVVPIRQENEGVTSARFNGIRHAKGQWIGFVDGDDEIETDIEMGKIKSDKQIRTLRFVIENGDIIISDLEMFADTTRSVVNTLCKNGYLEIIEKQVERNPFENKQIERDSKLILNEEQQKAYDTVCESMEDMLFSEFLIFGITGSRKNRNLFTTNRESIKRRKNEHFTSTRNFFNTTDCKSFYC